MFVGCGNDNDFIHSMNVSDYGYHLYFYDISVWVTYVADFNDSVHLIYGMFFHLDSRPAKFIHTLAKYVSL